MLDEYLVEKMELTPPRLRETVEEFQDATPRERIEYLLEYAANLPELPPRLQDARRNGAGS
jgi:sulfur transfer protein SufE